MDNHYESLSFMYVHTHTVGKSNTYHSQQNARNQKRFFLLHIKNQNILHIKNQNIYLCCLKLTKFGQNVNDNRQMQKSKRYRNTICLDFILVLLIFV